MVLARRLYRTFVHEDADMIMHDDLKNAFDNNEEAESAFSMFDKDLNGDISMQELEAVCVEIGRERKSITASLKDLDSVVSKLDAVLLFFVLIATLLVLLSLISTSAAGVLTSAGSAVSLAKRNFFFFKTSLTLGRSWRSPGFSLQLLKNFYNLCFSYLLSIPSIVATESISMAVLGHN